MREKAELNGKWPDLKKQKVCWKDRVCAFNENNWRYDDSWDVEKV